MQDLKDLKCRFFKRFRRREGENPANPIILQILIQTTSGIARDRPSRYGDRAFARDRPSRYGDRGVV